jgi:GDP-D-mannose 3',5'-epimerase
MKQAIVFGGGGFIGNHLVLRLKEDGFRVTAVDLKYPEFSKSIADNFFVGDLRDRRFVNNVFNAQFDEVYQLAADMGGAGYINSGDNDANVMSNSVEINVNVLQRSVDLGIKGIFFSSTACVYPESNQMHDCSLIMSEDSVYPAEPDTEYGWEKLFSERMYLAYNKNYGMRNKIGRYHNVYGPLGTWSGGKEKAPAAICRKVATSNGEIEIWGDGTQRRSFLYIDECIKATVDFNREENYFKPLNIGAETHISIDDLVDIVCRISGRKLTKKYVPGPIGVHVRASDNRKIREVLGYAPNEDVEDGLSKTYAWIARQVNG